LVVIMARVTWATLLPLAIKAMKKEVNCQTCRIEDHRRPLAMSLREHWTRRTTRRGSAQLKQKKKR
jgi:hypothetical protein